MLHFHTSNIHQNFHHSNQNHSKTCKLFLHCREQCIHQCMCVWLKFFTSLFSRRWPLALNPSFVLSVLLASVCFLILLVVWTVLGPMTIFLAQFAFGASPHLVVIALANPTTPFFKVPSNPARISSTLTFSSSPSPLLTALQRGFPLASRQLALGPAVNLCQSLL